MPSSSSRFCQVFTPADAIIGRYNVWVQTYSSDAEKSYSSLREFPEQSFILLFNPWCKGDMVYMDDTEWRKEYVLNETGRIWQGSAKRHHGQPWNFGQVRTWLLLQLYMRTPRYLVVHAAAFVLS